MTTELNEDFQNIKCYRLQKKGNKLNSVKMIFNSRSHLNKAIKEGIFLENHHCPVDELISNQHEPTRCYKCNKFHKSIARLCLNPVSCGYCSESHKFTECHNKIDASKVKCSNYNEPHPANDKSCTTYLQAKEKLINSSVSFFNNHHVG